jgi:hypothetical protein
VPAGAARVGATRNLRAQMAHITGLRRYRDLARSTRFTRLRAATAPRRDELPDLGRQDLEAIVSGAGTGLSARDSYAADVVGCEAPTAGG